MSFDGTEILKIFPPEKTGWPWTEATPSLPAIMSDGSPWPKISIVTPSFNQAQYLEETIRSVLLQGYPNLEYIIIDGGSKDGSLEIINRYEPWLSYRISEPDLGQSHAINKGWQRATGEIVSWVNSDDWYEPGTLNKVAEYFIENPDKNIVIGDCHLVNQDDLVFDNVFNIEKGFKDIIRFWEVRSIPTQPALFFRRKLLDIHGYLDPSLNYAMDYDLWLRFSRQNRFYHVEQFFANYRFHPGSKGGEQEWNRFIPEWKKVFRRYVGFNPGLWLIYFRIELRSFAKRIKHKAFSNDKQTN